MGDADNTFQFRAQQDLLSQLLARTKTLELDNAEGRPFAPQLISSTTFPTYTSTSLQGTLMRRRNWVFMRWQMVLSGWTAGTGAYAIRVPGPLPPNNLVAANQVVGQWWGEDVSATGYTAGFLVCTATTVPATGSDFWLTNNSGGLAAITGTAPWTWANGDLMSGTMYYEVAPGY